MNLVFETKRAAVEFLTTQKYLTEDNGVYIPRGTYYLAHGEKCQPEFKAVRYKDGWGIKKIHFYYYNTLHAPKDGRCALLDGELVLESRSG